MHTNYVSRHCFAKGVCVCLLTCLYGEVCVYKTWVKKIDGVWLCMYTGSCDSLKVSEGVNCSLTTAVTTQIVSVHMNTNRIVQHFLFWFSFIILYFSKTKKENYGWRLNPSCFFAMQWFPVSVGVGSGQNILLLDLVKEVMLLCSPRRGLAWSSMWCVLQPSLLLSLSSPSAHPSSPPLNSICSKRGKDRYESSNMCCTDWRRQRNLI